MGLKEEYSINGKEAPAFDAEKGGPPVYVDEAPAVTGETFVTGDSLYARIQRFVTRFGVEPRGIERVPEDERTDTNLRQVGTLVSRTTLIRGGRDRRQAKHAMMADMTCDLVVGCEHGGFLIRNRRIGNSSI